VHAGSLEPVADDGLAACFDQAGADEQAALAEPVVAHAGGVVLEVAQGGADLVFLHAFEGVLAGGPDDAVDVAVVEVFQPGGDPFFLPVAEHELELAGEVVDVLAGVEQIHDLGGLGELRGGDIPGPGGAVAEDGELADVARAAADALGSYQVPERACGLEGRHVAFRAAVADRVSLLVQRGLGEEDRELDLAGAGAAVLALALPAGGLLRRNGDAGAVDGGAELVRQRVRRQRDQLAGRHERGPVPDGGRGGGAAGLGGALDPLDRQPDPASSSSRPAASSNGTAAAARSVIAASPGDIDAPAAPSSASRGARPCPQAVQ
jgi:hypothetical protein